MKLFISSISLVVLINAMHSQNLQKMLLCQSERWYGHCGRDYAQYAKCSEIMENPSDIVRDEVPSSMVYLSVRNEIY